MESQSLRWRLGCREMGDLWLANGFEMRSLCVCRVLAMRWLCFPEFFFCFCKSLGKCVKVCRLTKEKEKLFGRGWRREVSGIDFVF